MRITCPNCGFSRDVPPEKLPQRPVRATCPQCRHKFPFAPTAPAPASEPAPPAAPQAADADVWEALNTLPGHTPLQAGQTEPEEPTTRPGQRPFALLRPDPSADDDTEDTTVHHEPTEEPVTPVPPAWETDSAAPVAAYLATLRAIVLSPVRFFRSLPVGAGYTKPLLFFLVLAEAVAVAQALWQLAGVLPPAPLTEGLGHTGQATVALLLYPLQISFYLFLDTVVNHFFLQLFRGAHKGLEGTFRAQAYSAAPMLLLVIPYLGLPMAIVATTVYKFLALRHVHGAETHRVLAALVVPIALMFAVAIILTWLTGTMA